MMKLEKKKANNKMLRCGKFLLPIEDRTFIMGILNRTPDSFSDGGMFMNEELAIKHIHKLVKDGADIIDVGGQSTRPGAKKITLEEELERTIPLIKKISKKINVPISIDTSRHEVAFEAIRAGASMVNDITGLKSDKKIAGVISDSDVAVSIMHIKGTPLTMQRDPRYEDLITEIKKSLKESIDIARACGISEKRIVIDPGIGFGKTTKHNLCIISSLREFKESGVPILIGVSRKSFIGNVVGREVNERLIGSVAASVVAILNGANIIRVHDVKEMVDAARMADALKR
jgi:dihydropteroate synthase